LISLFDRRQPEGIFIREVVTRAPRAVALDEGRGAEVLEARPGRRQRLAAALRPGGGVHREAVTNP